MNLRKNTKNPEVSLGYAPKACLIVAGHWFYDRLTSI
jgi:hypothetical protein